jgi:predicted DNA binding CopG/RHH family protein
MESRQVRNIRIPAKERKMRKEYDFSKATKNPYAKRVKKQLTIRVDDTTIEYFRKLAEEVNVPYQTLINMYLRDCASSRRRLAMKWVTAA